MDVIIFDMGDGWGFASPSTDERHIAPVNIVGDWQTWRIWRTADLPEAMWEAAKLFFVNLAGALDGDDVEAVAA